MPSRTGCGARRRSRRRSGSRHRPSPRPSCGSGEDLANRFGGRRPRRRSPGPGSRSCRRRCTVRRRVPWRPTPRPRDRRPSAVPSRRHRPGCSQARGCRSGLRVAFDPVDTSASPVRLGLQPLLDEPTLFGGQLRCGDLACAPAARQVSTRLSVTSPIPIRRSMVPPRRMRSGAWSHGGIRYLERGIGSSACSP